LPALLLIAALSLAAPNREDPTPKEARSLHEQLIGDWLQVKRVIGGTDQPNLNNLTLVFTGDSLQHVQVVNGVKKPGPSFSYSLDATKAPAVISFRTSKYEGILKIEGDLLTICYSQVGDSRPPAQFLSTANPPTTLLQATRIKK
jgi:uncharacterized protein (TIGR03067 family)